MIVVDRIEGNKVIIEIDNEFAELPISLFPSEVSEGDIIEMDIKINVEETDKRRKETSEKLKNLFNRWK